VHQDREVSNPIAIINIIISNTTMGFVVESDGTEDKDSFTENMRPIERGDTTRRHYMEMSCNFKPR